MTMRYFAQFIKIKLGDIGEGTKEAKIKKWHVQEGQRIKEVILTFLTFQFENICDVETDKATAEIPSTHDGIVKKLHFKLDEVCRVGHALAEIEVDEAPS